MCCGRLVVRVGRFVRCLLLVGCGLLLVLGVTVEGEDAFHRGLQAYQAEEYERARQVFRDLFAETPAYVDERHGAVAYWLGKAYEACNQPDSMRWAWRKGVRVLRDTGRFDVRLFDAHLRATWSPHRTNREKPIEVYLAILEHVGTERSDAERTIFRRHVAQLRPLLGTKQRDRLLKSGDVDDPQKWIFQNDAGEWLAAWWRRQDPTPATALNERIVEHLNRVQKARTSFSTPDRLAGWDERGDLYVRYGPPARRDSIPFTSARFHREVIRFGVGVHRADFPKNEIWSYPHVGTRGHYLFVQNKGRYELGQTMDLIPSKLKGSFHAAERSMNRAYSAMAAMRYVYRHLAMHYSMESGRMYNELANYFSNQEVMEDLLAGNPNAGSSVGEGAGERTVYRSPSSRRPPSEIASEAVMKTRHRQRVFLRKRKKEMPRRYSPSATSETPLPIAVRTARFLEDDGTTRVEVYWGGNLTAGELGTDRQVISTSLVRYGPHYERQQITSTQHVFEETEGDSRRIAPNVLTTTSTTDPFHLSIQWDRHDAFASGADTRLGERTGRQTIRVDTLRTLSSDPSRLEMSDLRPMVAEGQQFNPARPAEGATPYPFSTLAADAPLLLYFKVYHLTPDAKDRTRYKVSYEMRRETDDGGFLGIGGGGVERTETTSSYTGTSRTTTELIRLDWGDAVPEDPQPVRVTVHVTDEVSGQQVERTVNFRLLPPQQPR